MRCADVDLLIEAMADNTFDGDAAGRAHVAGCARCAARLAQAVEVHALLATREAPEPPPGFTARVIARVERRRWEVERVIDLGFNLAVAGGALLIVAGGLGLAWWMGLLGIGVDIGALLDAGAAEWATPLVSRLQSIAVAAALLTMTLGLWWWAETDLSL